MHQVIFHVSDLDKWQMTLGNVSNLTKEFNKLEENYHIIVLANGPAVKNYLDDKLIETILSYNNNLVTFKACNNALNANKIDPLTLNKQIKVVPAGVYELTIKQKQGYSYIKA